MKTKTQNGSRVWLILRHPLTMNTLLMKSPTTHSQSLAAFRKVLVLIALAAAASQISFAALTGGSPIKNLSGANPNIHWPADVNPAKADAFVHNEIYIKASAKVVWENLVQAGEWPNWYSNSADIKIEGSDAGQLQAGSVFTWKTFGFPIDSQVHEFVPGSRLGWYGGGTGIRAYHTWLIVPKGNGCEVVTEESQVGPSAIKFNAEQPTAMFDGHHWWLAALKVRCERAAH